MVTLLPYGALEVIRGPDISEVIGGSLFWGSLASSYPGMPDPRACGRPGPDVLSWEHLGPAVAYSVEKTF